PIGITLAPATVPDPPTNVAATAGSASATVTFSPPASDGGSSITSYTATATDHTNPAHGGQSATASGSPITVTGLTNGDSYTLTVTATNTVGTGPPSQPSNAVVPEATSVATSPQFGVPNQTDVFSIADSGALQVRWVVGAGKWHGPLTISPPGLAPAGARQSTRPNSGDANQRDAVLRRTN